MTKLEIAERLRNARINAGYTQKDVAAYTGRSSKLVGHWETGYSQPDADTIASLLRLYNVDANDFFDIHEHNPGSISEIESSQEEAVLIKNYRAADVDGKISLLKFSGYVAANNTVSVDGIRGAVARMSAIAAEASPAYAQDSDTEIKRGKEKA